MQNNPHDKQLTLIFHSSLLFCAKTDDRKAVRLCVFCYQHPQAPRREMPVSITSYSTDAASAAREYRRVPSSAAMP